MCSELMSTFAREVVASCTDVIYLAVTVVVFAAIWFALRGVEKL